MECNTDEAAAPAETATPSDAESVLKDQTEKEEIKCETNNEIEDEIKAETTMEKRQQFETKYETFDTKQNITTEVMKTDESADEAEEKTNCEAKVDKHELLDAAKYSTENLTNENATEEEIERVIKRQEMDHVWELTSARLFRPPEPSTFQFLSAKPKRGSQQMLQNFANAKESKKTSRSVSLKAAVGRTSNRKRRANTRQIMAEWTQTFDAPKFDIDSFLILILLILALIVCPVLNIAKSKIMLPFKDFTAPLGLKHRWSMAVNVASIIVGVLLMAYILLLSCLRSVFPLLEAPKLSYSELLLNSMHSTVGARLAYGCILQGQVLKRKFYESKL